MNFYPDNVDETGRLIGGFVRYLAKSEHRGEKFKETSLNKNSERATLNLELVL
jgi:hypothetical protein